MIDNLLDQLRRDEGMRLTPYRDSVGKLTIGVGRNLDDVGISPDEAEYLLSSDLKRAATEVARVLPWVAGLDDVRRAVIINMAFNMGCAALLQFRNTLKMIQSGDFAGAAAEMLDSKWAKQVGDRAERLAKQLETGEWV